MEIVKDYIVYDRYYLRINESEEITKTPWIRKNGFDEHCYVGVNGNIKEMQLYYGKTNPKDAIISMYKEMDKSVKGVTTIILDYLLVELKLDHKYVMDNLTRESNAFLNSLNDTLYEDHIFREMFSLFSNFKELKEWLTGDRIDKLLEISKQIRSIRNARSHKVCCF